MNTITPNLKDRISWIYEQVLLRPYMFCHAAEIETFIMGVEFVLDELDPERPDRYRAFLGEKGFGMGRFESQFERDNHCSVTMSQRHSDEENQRTDLSPEYEQAFTDHWKAFLEWKRTKSST